MCIRVCSVPLCHLQKATLMEALVDTSCGYASAQLPPLDGIDDQEHGTSTDGTSISGRSRKKFKLSGSHDECAEEGSMKTTVDNNNKEKALKYNESIVDNVTNKSIKDNLQKDDDNVINDANKSNGNESDDVEEDAGVNNLNPEDDANDDGDDNDASVQDNELDDEEEEYDVSGQSEDDYDDDEVGSDDVDNDDDESMIRSLRRAAAAQGIPFEFLIRQAMMSHGDDDDDDDNEQQQIEYPFGTLPKSLDDVAQFILSDKCRNILILSGAGMSVSAGIPDFRSADGLYATLNPDLLTADPSEREAIRSDPTIALEHNMFLQNPLPLLELQREFILGTHERKWKATIAHRFVELLYSKTSKLVRLYTQNIDGLEDQCSQLPHDKVIAVHGSMDRAQCERCQSTMEYDTFCQKVKEQIKDLSRQDTSAPAESTAIICPTCTYNTMKPSIVLFRSSLPRVFFQSVPNDVQDIDLLIIMGTSLRVAPANSIVWRVPKTCLRVLVNREEVGDHLGMFAYNNSDDDDDNDDDDNDCDEEKQTNTSGEDDNNNNSANKRRGRDYFARGECDTVLLELMDKLGWLDELQPLLDQQQLPVSSANVLRDYIKTKKVSSD